MPALSNPRHEAFAQELFRSIGRPDFSQANAYLAAGYTAKAGNSAESAASSRLRLFKGISLRVQELLAQSGKRKKVTVETIADELDEARALAKETGQASALVSATTTKGKLYGLFVDRQEQGKPGDFSQAQSTDDLVDRLLKDKGAEIVTNAMRQAAIEEMNRHDGVLAFIAAGSAPERDQGDKCEVASQSVGRGRGHTSPSMSS